MTADAPAARWMLFAVISTIFFLISAGTFSSLGVVLPFMIRDLSWTKSEAGTGFSLLALTVGLASHVPAWILRRLGIKSTYGIGGAIMASGFALLALTNGLELYFVAAALLGLGFACCATVPGVYLLNGWMPHRRAETIGAFMTAGGLGAVAGPLAARWIIAAADSWRLYWWAMMASILALTVLALIFVRTPPSEAVAAIAATAAKPGPKDVYRTNRDWQFRHAIRTPQFWTISIAMTATLLCVLTSSSWAFTHMGTLGVSASVAAGALSAEGAVSALSRAFGGALATRIDPKHLLLTALVGETIGIAALSVADNPIAISIFAVGSGFGFGMCLFATAMLLVNYFGPSENPEIFGTFNFITTAAMIGPAIAGFFADKLGGFATVFQGFVALMAVMVIITAAMRPPRLPAQ
jgi:MFS family permease